MQVAPTTTEPSICADACYSAMQARDARFDGRFFVGVTSTRIYCRPVCRVKCPKRANCLFFGHPAQAEKAGFRPCLRCRPELAPHALLWSTQDASAVLAQQAVAWLDTPENWATGTPTIHALAARLGVSDRHLRRIFEAQLGVTPLQYLQTRRLLCAKQLLTDTVLPITQVAAASGFASLRRFNAAFVAHYCLNPGQLRRAGAEVSHDMTLVKLGYIPPFDVSALLAFFAKRALASVEIVDAQPQGQGVTRTMTVGQHHGWVQVRFDETRCQALLQVSNGLHPVLPLVIRRVRAWLDLDANPAVIDHVLSKDFPGTGGLRVPGCVDGFELAVRAVLGQQITVAAARTLSQRLLDTFGTVIETPWPALNRLFPSPAVLAQASGDALGQLGIVKQRQAAIVALAQAVTEHKLVLHSGYDVAQTISFLKTLPGIGEWTAQYIAMRALRWPDAFPAGDVALHKAMGLQGEKNPARAAEIASQIWRPWRSYAVLRAWQTLGTV